MKNWYQVLSFLPLLGSLGGCTYHSQPTDPIVVNMTERKTFVVPENYLGNTNCPNLKRLFTEEQGLAILLHKNEQGQCEVIIAPAKKRMNEELQQK